MVKAGVCLLYMIHDLFGYMLSYFNYLELLFAGSSPAPLTIWPYNSMVECLFYKQKVPSSNLGEVTKQSLSSMVERCHDMANVIGSNPLGTTWDMKYMIRGN